MRPALSDIISLSKRFIVWAACMAAERAMVVGTVVEIRHIAVSLRNVDGAILKT